MKAIVIYYSLTGKTELAAKSIAETLKIKSKKLEELKLRKGLLGFLRSGYDAIKEVNSEIKSLDINISDYDLIFIGTPVWAFKPVPAINAFIANTNFAGKKAVAFVTMGGSGDKNTIKILKEKIEAKRGTLIASFSIRTGGLIKDADIVEKGKQIGKEFITFQAQP